MAFAHQYTHAGTAASLSASQVMLTTKSSHSPKSPQGLDHARALMHESGLPLLHFLPRMNGLTEAVYGQGQLTPNGLGVEPSAFYPMGSPPGHLPGAPDQWKGLAGQAPVMYPFDPMLAVHPYASFYGGLDLNNAARRKNATRETTSALKAWLYEHRKNPYPTKGEKIMLAIITKMTLTQVSTWFANARRRLKKESKSWNGKDRDLDDSDTEADGDEGTNGNEEKSSLGSLQLTFSGNDSDDDEDFDIKVTSDLSDISDAEDEQTTNGRTNNNDSRLSIYSDSSSSRSFKCESRLTVSSPLRTETSSNVNQGQINPIVVSSAASRPKIWSIEEIMNKDSPRQKSNTTPQHQVTSEHTSREGNVHKTEQMSQTDSINSHKFVLNGLKQSGTSLSRSRTETAKSPSEPSP